MKKEIANLANYLAIKQDIHFTEIVLKENLPTIFQILLNKSILTPTKPIDSVKCKECDFDHLEQVIEINHRYFTKCQYSEYASLLEVQPEELNSYRFSLRAFLAWIAEVLTKETETKQLNENTWLLGHGIDQNLYFIKSQDYTEAQNEAKKINTENNLFLWLGVKPLIGYSTIELMSIQDIVRQEKNTLEIQPLRTKSKKAKPNAKDIVLDTDIVLTNDFHLLLCFENGTFSHKLKTFPQTYRIVRYLYDQRKYGKAYTSKELSESLLLDNQKVIPTRIKELNNICDKYKVKNVILSYPNREWALNPDLTCFN